MANICLWRTKLYGNMKTKCDSCIGPTSSEQATVYCLYIHFRTLSGPRISKYNTYLHWSCTISLPFRSSKLQLVFKSFHCRLLTRLGVCSPDASAHSAQDHKCVVQQKDMYASQQFYSNTLCAASNLSCTYIQLCS